MTLVSAIVTAALRETNLIGSGVEPTEVEKTETLARLQSLVLSVRGNEAGEGLAAMALGRHDIQSPAGYPWYSNELPGRVFVPVNTRLMLNLTGDGTVYLSPVPRDGARMAVTDVSQNLSTYPLTIYGNGRSIEGDEAITLDEDGLVREWFYRNDLGNWMKVTDLELDDEFPFPPEFDDMFIIMLAARMNPRYGQTLDPASQQMMVRSRTQFRARYRQNRRVGSESGLLRTTGEQRYWNRTSYGDPSALFDTGYLLDGTEG